MGAGKKRYSKVCELCGKKFTSSRIHAQTCTLKCRKSKSRWNREHPLIPHPEAHKWPSKKSR